MYTLRKRWQAASAAAALVVLGACGSIADAPVSIAGSPMAPSAPAATTSGTSLLGPIVLDSVFIKAAMQVYASGNTDSANALMVKRANLLAAQSAAEKLDAVTSAAARLALRTYEIGASLEILGASIATTTQVAVDSALVDAQARIAYWQSKGTNVTQSVSIAATAASQLGQAKLTSDPATKLDLATKAGSNITIVRILLKPAPVGGVVVPPPPPTTGLWSTIETPRAWDYVPTAVDQAACGASGKTYDVGPGKTYATPGLVPWLSLLPCDNVRIFWRATPYSDVIFLSNRGAAHKYIRIVGMPGPGGEKPVLDGSAATIKPGTPFINNVFDGLGMIVVSVPTGYTYGYKPGYLEIANLEIRNASKVNSHTNLAGQSVPWQAFASGIYIERAENVAIRNCLIHDNGNGIFQNSKYDEAGQSRYLLIEGNDIHDNGVVGDAHEHNSYTEGVGTVYQFNHFGQIASGSYGDNIKDRSAGITIRYNYIEGGVNPIALPDPQSNGSWERIQKDAWGSLLVNSAYIYGNVVVSRDRPDFKILWTRIFVEVGDGPFSYGNVRGGTVYVHHNTFIAQYNATQWSMTSTVLFALENTGTNNIVQARNNVFHTRPLTAGAKASPLAIFWGYGNADFSTNWISGGYLPIEPSNHSGGSVLNMGTPWDGTGITNMLSIATNNPGFVNAAQDDYHLLASSPVIGSGVPLSAEVLKTGNAPLYEYVSANVWKLRNNATAPALGAFEP
ncbi:hypothetical protein BH09GEM1_BH09GEM1_00380 [soil metagenome]